MKSSRLAFVILVAVWLGFAAFVWTTSSQLPDRVATHFDVAGQANGWMSRAQHRNFTIGFGTIVPLFMVGVFSFIRARAGDSLNIPNKDYWLAPERRQESVDFVYRRGLGLATIMVGFIGGVHVSILRANAAEPPHLPGAQVAWIAGGFGVAVLVWAVLLVRRFIRRPA